MLDFLGKFDNHLLMFMLALNELIYIPSFKYTYVLYVNCECVLHITKRSIDYQKEINEITEVISTNFAEGEDAREDVSMDCRRQAYLNITLSQPS